MRAGSVAFHLTPGVTKRMRKAGSLIARTPLFSNTNPSFLQIAEIQAFYALRGL